VSEVRRYECYYTDYYGDECPAFARAESDGRWVDYDDHAAALAEKDAEIAQLKEDLEIEYAADRATNYSLGMLYRDLEAKGALLRRAVVLLHEARRDDAMRGHLLWMEESAQLLMAIDEQARQVADVDAPGVQP
jgi:hypothetical protein